MKISTKGLNRKQIIMLLEGLIGDDNVCITEGDMCLLFNNFADVYEAENKYGETVLTLSKQNDYWSGLRTFLPRLGDKVKGFKLYEPQKTGQAKSSED